MNLFPNFFNKFVFFCLFVLIIISFQYCIVFPDIVNAVLMDEKSKEVLETPQVHLFKHENVFGNSFKDEITKVIKNLIAFIIFINVLLLLVLPTQKEKTRNCCVVKYLDSSVK